MDSIGEIMRGSVIGAKTSCAFGLGSRGGIWSWVVRVHRYLVNQAVEVDLGGQDRSTPPPPGANPDPSGLRLALFVRG